MLTARAAWPLEATAGVLARKIAGCPKPGHRGLPAATSHMNAPVDVSFFTRAAKPLTSYRKYWAARFGTARFLPTSR